SPTRTTRATATFTRRDRGQALVVTTYGIVHSSHTKGTRVNRAWTNGSAAAQAAAATNADTVRPTNARCVSSSRPASPTNPSASDQVYSDVSVVAGNSSTSTKHSAACSGLRNPSPRTNAVTSSAPTTIRTASKTSAARYAATGPLTRRTTGVRSSAVPMG